MDLSIVVVLRDGTGLRAPGRPTVLPHVLEDDVGRGYKGNDPCNEGKPALDCYDDEDVARGEDL